MNARLVFVAAVLSLSACAGNSRPTTPTPSPIPAATSPTPPPPPPTSSASPDHVSVDHILIGVKNPRMPDVHRTADEAREIAESLLARLRSGADWESAKRANSDDPPPGGPYAMSNRGVTPAPGEVARGKMVPAFGDVGFRLAVGEIGLAPYDARTSPFGVHLIKRVR